MYRHYVQSIVWHANLLKSLIQVCFVVECIGNTNVIRLDIFQISKLSYFLIISLLKRVFSQLYIQHFVFRAQWYITIFCLLNDFRFLSRFKIETDLNILGNQSVFQKKYVSVLQTMHQWNLYQNDIYQCESSFNLPFLK